MGVWKLERHVFVRVRGFCRDFRLYTKRPARCGDSPARWFVFVLEAEEMWREAGPAAAVEGRVIVGDGEEYGLLLGAEAEGQGEGEKEQ